MTEGHHFNWLFDRKIVQEHRSLVVKPDTCGTASISRHFASDGHTYSQISGQ